MGRWSQYDTDEERLPEGMVRIGYDADDQTYTFRDTNDGSIWESAPGNQYGRLTRISGPSSSSSGRHPNETYSDGDAPPPPYDAGGSEPNDSWSGHQKVSWRADMMPLLNFFMIIGLFLIGVFWFLHKTVGTGSGSEGGSGSGGDVVLKCSADAHTYRVQRGDTCWDIAQGRGLEVDDILKENKGLECNNLEIGDLICVPTTS
ncbi:peptidoglycan-binding LysM domain-containingprotein [Apiospora kogelbergensis]|uniref:Peptidoglycan-binding LysM domain-containingprotein n=1 Tax=Apiospora kogelbergensis TaxID=1337665 RepID=A0AAW0Q5B3_9PEZI